MQISSSTSTPARASRSSSAAAKAKQGGASGQTPSSYQSGMDAAAGSTSVPYSKMASGASGEAQARQAQAASQVTRGLGGGQTFEDLAAKFDKDKMQKDIKKGQVASGTGVNHNATTEATPRTPSSANRSEGSKER